MEASLPDEVKEVYSAIASSSSDDVAIFSVKTN